jgi:transketolase C-terminal domain/subunit
LADFSVYAFRDFPQDRLFNVGIREQLMVGMAAGLVLEGLIPVCYTIAPFLLERAYEFIKLDLCGQGLHAILVGYNGTDEFYGDSHKFENKRLLDGMAIQPWWVKTPSQVITTLNACLDRRQVHYVEIK